MLRRGDIHWGEVTEAESRGKELRAHDGFGDRPYLIVSDSRMEKKVACVVAVPLSTAAHPVRGDLEPYRVDLQPSDIVRTPEDVGPVGSSAACCDQVRVMSVERFRKPVSRLGKLTAVKLAEVELRLLNVFNLR